MRVEILSFADPRGKLHAEALMVVAGRLAEKRALRGSEPGWVRLLSLEQRTAYHESGHAVVAAACGLYVH
ncbi:MAG: hypothetical protein ACR2JB_19095 [Bryobacteraceae bacterium]